MSSIKRDVKKKLLPRPENESVSRDPAHCGQCFCEEVSLVVHSRGFPLCRHEGIEFVRAASVTGGSVSTMVLSEARGL